MVELGEHRPVDGAPLARITARFTWGVSAAEIRRREGDTQIRTPEGPRTLDEVLDEVDEPYFSTRQAFETAVRDVISDGPVPVAEDEGSSPRD